MSKYSFEEPNTKLFYLLVSIFRKARIQQETSLQSFPSSLVASVVRTCLCTCSRFYTLMATWFLYSS